MYLPPYLACLTMGISLMTSCNMASEPTNFASQLPPTMISTPGDNLPNLSGFNIPITVQLIPYEVAGEKVIDYADISLAISNTSRRETTVEIIQIAVLAAGSNQVLLVAMPQELGLPSKVSMNPGETQNLEYHLRSEVRRYESGQRVIAAIRYRQSGKPENLALSNSEQVTVRNR